MSLKTDYKDAVYSGDRRYAITENGDGTSKITDSTVYSQEGTRFGANDINNTNAAVNRLNHVTEITLNKNSWEGNFAPYTQSVSVSGITVDDEPLVVSALVDGASVDTQKAYNKAFAILCAGTATTSDGKITFKVYKKPATTITVGLKGA